MFWCIRLFANTNAITIYHNQRNKKPRLQSGAGLIYSDGFDRRSLYTTSNKILPFTLTEDLSPNYFFFGITFVYIFDVFFFLDFFVLLLGLESICSCSCHLNHSSSASATSWYSLYTNK